MGYDRYGLDWSLRGAKSNAAAAPAKTPADDTIGRGWSAPPEKKQQEPEEAGSTRPSKEESAASPTVRIKKAELVAGDVLDFNKPCTARAEIDGKDAKGQVCFSLWAKYNDTDYDLNHKKSAPINDNTAETQLTLYYVDAYTEALRDAPDSAGTVEYYAKVSLKGANPAESGTLVLPQKKNTCVVVINDDAGKPVANVKIVLDDGREFVTDEDGKVEIDAGEGCTEITVKEIVQPVAAS